MKAFPTPFSPFYILIHMVHGRAAPKYAQKWLHIIVCVVKV